MATHSSIVAWRIPWTEKPGGLRSIGSQRVRYDWAHTHTKWISYMYTYIPSPLDLPLTPPSMPPVLVTTGTKLSFLSYIAGFHSILQMIVIWFLCILFPAFPSPPKLYTISQPQTIPEINKDCVKPRSSKFSSKTEQMHQRTSGYMEGAVISSFQEGSGSRGEDNSAVIPLILSFLALVTVGQAYIPKFWTYVREPQQKEKCKDSSSLRDRNRTKEEVPIARAAFDKPSMFTCLL